MLLFYPGADTGLDDAIRDRASTRRASLRCTECAGINPKGAEPTAGAAEDQRRKAGNSTFGTPGDGAGSDTRNLRGVMPNSPPNSLNLLTCQDFFPGLAGEANSAFTPPWKIYGLRKQCRIWEGGIPCFFLRWSSAAQRPALFLPSGKLNAPPLDCSAIPRHPLRSHGLATRSEVRVQADLVAENRRNTGL